MDTDAAKWIKLAAYARDIANEMHDPINRKAMQEIAERYDAIARRAIRKTIGERPDAIKTIDVEG